LIETMFTGSQAYSFKPLVGHCQSSAALVEVACNLLSWHHDYLPAPVPVAAAHRQLLPGPVQPADGLVMKTSLGMGGHNYALVLEPPR
jgi:3-oxoacyl-[acyl-carrier-protein] synthase II